MDIWDIFFGGQYSTNNAVVNIHTGFWVNMQKFP